MDRLLKRRRTGADAEDESDRSATPTSLSHSISPPRKKIRPQAGPAALPAKPEVPAGTQTFRSPFRLTEIRDLPSESNIDTVTLKSILGDPLIAECWEFNYLHDVDFLVGALDEDVRHSVQVHVVHGFWKREDPSRRALEDQASRHSNVTLHVAFMPEMFGTHHSKMMILLRHDDTAQVVITTANMIPRDWANMTQGVWQSPLLPLAGGEQPGAGEAPPTGSGAKFKIDLLNYLRAYNTKRAVCKSLVDKLAGFDFSAVRGALIASVPGRHAIHDDSPTRWGWAAIKQTLRTVPAQEGTAEIVAQVSSIATLGPKDAWLRATFFAALSQAATGPSTPKLNFKVVFPTPDEIRRSLDGYGSGGSIHTKIDSQQQQKQLEYMRPMMCHWANDAPGGAEREEGAAVSVAGRKRAAPHIKTYIRYGKDGLDWALLTSANLSKQAWGEAARDSGDVRIASWEIGVLVWPALFAEGAAMRPAFGHDTPSRDGLPDDAPAVGLRVPYDLPLQRYGPQEKPWVATKSYAEPDWRGDIWPGF